VSDTAYVTSGPPATIGQSPVAPTLAEAITAAQANSSLAANSAAAAAASATVAANSATTAANAQAAVAAYESTVIADLATVQADVINVTNQVTVVNATAATLIGDLGAAQTAAASASADAITATNAAGSASSSATAANNSATAAAASAATVNTANLLAKANNLSDVASVATARTNLAIDGRTSRGDANYTILATDVVVAITAAWTLGRTFTLPAANAVNAGRHLLIIDQIGTISAAHQLTLAPAGTNILNNANAPDSFSTPFLVLDLVSDGSTTWNYAVRSIAEGGTGATTAAAALTALGAVGLASPAFTGVPTAPTPATADNSTTIATTALVANKIAAIGAPVTSVFGRSGTVVAAANDYSFAQLSGSVGATQMPALTGAVTMPAGSTVTTLASISNDVAMAGDLLATNIAAPATPGAGSTRIYVDQTQKILSAKNDAGTISSTVVPSSGSAGQFATGIGANGVVSYATPAAPNFSALSGTASMAQLPANAIVAAIEFVLDGGGAALTTGVKGYLEVPFNCTITRATLLGDQSGSVTIDIWRTTYALFNPGTHPVVGDSLTAAAVPAIASGVKYQDSGLTGWTKTLSAGDVLAFNVKVAATAITRVTCSLLVTKT
jgi:hypothetical protein